MDSRALVCCVVAALALVGGLVAVLSRAEPHRSGTNGVLAQAQLIAPAGTTVCQGREVLPAGTAAVEIPGDSTAAPLVVLRRDGREHARVEAALDRRQGVVRAPIAPSDRTLAGVEVCLVMREAAVFARGPTPPGVGTVRSQQVFAGSSLAIEYVRQGASSWWGFAGTLAERICGDRGHRDGGVCWRVLAFLALAAASLLLAGRIVVRMLVLDRAAPRLGVAIAAVAALSAAAWSFATPAFQVPDEVAHVAYVQSLAETGRPHAHPPALTISPEQAVMMRDTGFGSVAGRTSRAAAWSRHQPPQLEADLRRPLPRRASVAAGEAEPEPPLYYALEAIPYRAAHGATLLDRMMLMRLFSALLAGVTALLCFQFVRECLPAKPWAWTVGGLGVALMPMLGFIDGGVNPDALLFALSAGLFLCVARAWRRGATPRLALAIGLLIAAGVLTKVNFYALVPGALLGFALAARRTTLAWDRRVLRLVAGAALLACGLFAVGAAFEALVWHRSLVAARPVAPESHVSLWSHLGYVWQVFLPRLPFQPQTALSEPGYQQLFQSFVGAFGQMAVWFPTWVYRVLAVGFALVGLLVVRMLHADPRELRWRSGELLGYAAMAGALLVLIGLSADLRRHLVAIVQGRYLLPLLPLFGALLALGARGAGERWGRSTGVAIVATVAALGIFGQLLTIAWFYA
ncbi:MAG TPA: DUF2142 domain-containing protein [Conexibacter sp.]|nr:DUF2142 domain-containing protein [Conexibacter sp.]